MSSRLMLQDIVDYAGLFPPTSLAMRGSVENYARYLRHPQNWALGRFVLPVARLDEFQKTREAALKDDAANATSEPWHLSAILSPSIAADLAAVEVFNHAQHGAVVESVEVRVLKQEDLDLVRSHSPAGTRVFFEMSSDRLAEFLPHVQHIRGCAKLRLGGVTEDAFPAIEFVAEFLLQCAALEVPFKATAGLHHPMRCMRPLTNEPDSIHAHMHGFLNLFTAAAIAWTSRQSGREAPVATLATCLADRERANWHFGEDALTWSGDQVPVRIEVDHLAETRSKFALSFGSCSFDEPIEELRELDLL